MPPQNKPTGFIMTPPPINVSEVGPSDRTDSSQDQVGISRTCQKVDRPLDSTTNISFNKDFMKKDVISKRGCGRIRKILSLRRLGSFVIVPC